MGLRRHVGPADAFDPAHPSGHVWQFESEGVTDALYPDDAWLGHWYDADTVVSVATPDRALTQRIVDSVERVDGVDPNECPVRLPDAEAALNSTSDSLSICRYDERGLLTASRRLIGEQSPDEQDVLASSPIRGTDDTCPPPGSLPRTVILQGGGYVMTVITDAACEGNNGVFFGGVVREATDAVRRKIDLTRLP